MYLKINIKIFILLFFIFSCQPVEIITPIEYDNSRLEKIFINAKKITLNIKYNPIFSENNIEDQLQSPPIIKIQNWVNENIEKFGNQNEFVINIFDASILKKEIENLEAKKYEEKKVYLYEVFFLAQYELYDDSGFLLANTNVESSRSTTSQKYISLNETEIIINEMIHNAMIDFTKETKSMIKLYMSEFIN